MMRQLDLINGTEDYVNFAPFAEVVMMLYQNYSPEPVEVD